ncbi:MAG: phage tail protein [Actinobacteria bacterium]|nr:phage tail protein [Actinomycetota bacterium]
MTTDRTPDPAHANRFEFSVGGVTIGTFTEVSGLSVEVSVEEVAEGGQNQFVHKLPGPMKWPNIVLKAGVTSADDLFAWLSKSSGDRFDGKLERETGHIAVCDPAGNVVRRWNFAGAFAVRWSGPTLAAASSDLAVEELEIAHHGFTTGG